MPIRSFIVNEKEYRSLIDHYINRISVEYIINRPNLIVFRYSKQCNWFKELSLNNIKHGTINIITLDHGYILVTHYSNFFNGFRNLLKSKKIKYITVDTPSNDKISKIMFNFVSRYGPNCYDNFDLPVVFNKLGIEREHEFPLATPDMLNDIDSSRYAFAFVVKYNLEIVNTEYHLYDKESDTSYHIKLLYDAYDVIDICNSILSSKSKYNIVMLICRSHISKKMRIPLLITKEICRKHDRQVRVLRL
jgi:hypothetical protein